MASVLVVDDEEVVAELLSSTLESHGYLVPVACSGEDALRLVRLHLPCNGSAQLPRLRSWQEQMEEPPRAPGAGATPERPCCPTEASTPSPAAGPRDGR